MDKIGEANKPMEARVSDLLEVERRKKDDSEKSVVVYQPKDVDIIDTSAFIETKMQYGLDFVFRLSDSVSVKDYLAEPPHPPTFWKDFPKKTFFFGSFPNFQC